jgi:hypothetical protein
MCRTWYQCAGGGVPLCSIGNGKVDNDCFKIAHETEDRREMVCKIYDKMKKRNRRQQGNNYIGFMLRIKQGFLKLCLSFAKVNF